MPGIKPTPYQRACISMPEDVNLLLAGGRGGGKSILILLLLLKHAEKYGPLCKALYVRETYDSLTEIEQEFEALLGELYTGKNKVSHNKTDGHFVFPNGAQVTFGQISEQKHYTKFQGRSFTLIICDEYGAVKETRWINLLFSNIRGPKEVPKRVVLAANPGGAQHGLLHYDYINQAPAWTPYDKDGETWINCPSTWRDNPNIDHAAYLRKLKAACGNDEALFKAWDTGDWNISRGAYFAGCLDERIHKLSEAQFPSKILPRGWMPYLAMDWGSGAPCITGVFAESPGVDGFPKGSLILCDELALHEANDLNVGLNWPPSKLADAQIALANKWGFAPEGVGDDAYGLQETLLETLAEHGVYFVRPRKERVAGWQEMRLMLTNAMLRNGMPGLWISERCKYFWRTAPFVQRDDKRPEDILTTGPDHGVDMCFIKGTQVLTPEGEVSIETLTPGDLVVTRQGPKKILRTGTRLSETSVLTMSNGRSLQGTPDHPFFVEGGWKSLDSLRYADMLFSCQELILLNSKELLTADTQILLDENCDVTTPLTALREKQAEVDCTKKCGNTTRVRFRKDSTSIIKTKTHSITTSPISSVCLEPNTYQSTCRARSESKSPETTSSMRKPQRLRGTPPQKDLLGTARMQNTCGKKSSLSTASASIAQNLINQRRCLLENSVQTHANLHGVEPQGLTTSREPAANVSPRSQSISTPKSQPAPVHVVSVCSAKSSLVYNIEVEDCPEYFANGVLVHNCRYGVLHRGHGAFSSKTTGQY